MGCRRDRQLRQRGDARPMPLPTDPGELDAIADRIADHAVAARDRAARLGAAVAAAHWHGIAATAFEGQAALTICALRSAADRLDDAAVALRRHAAAVRGLLAGLAGGALAALSGPTDLLTVLGDPGRALRIASDGGSGAISGGAHLLGGTVDALGGAVDALGALGP
jgi:uncharacterized protein YukE